MRSIILLIFRKRDKTEHILFVYNIFRFFKTLSYVFFSKKQENSENYKMGGGKTLNCIDRDHHILMRSTKNSFNSMHNNNIMENNKKFSFENLKTH